MYLRLLLFFSFFLFFTSCVPGYMDAFEGSEKCKGENETSSEVFKKVYYYDGTGGYDRSGFIAKYDEDGNYIHDKEVEWVEQFHEKNANKRNGSYSAKSPHSGQDYEVIVVCD